MRAPVLDDDSAQAFGGRHSVLKLDTVEGYLNAFTSALRPKFNLVYIDAFAGSGSFKFGGSPALGFMAARPATVHDGSARRALAVSPPFDQLHFIDIDETNAEHLRSISAGRRGAHVHCEDANIAVRRICEQTDWGGRRGVIFLDPFDTAVAWDTLGVIAKTKSLDVWYLAPLAGIYRNAPHDHGDLTPEKKRTVTRILGTPDWEPEFYKMPTQRTFFDGDLHKSPRRVLDTDGIQNFMKRRLETVFPYVEKPRTLYGGSSGASPMFSLFFAMSNPSSAARRVALPIAQHLLKPKAGQFRR
ncbi:MAG: three-Cys-motif partner protein TcmP [Alphaproteobacteria bacterium]|nr:three-Cys-motif partner protein TcmP [Alphaproteobacteria bacterium]MBL6939475.1 three-Cys-motif partner protein TcmP [Alphaproteobacteria bacterium]MBL7097044.1 three-Cys-motif partner protein TcmP [Alphaproteobacteria bacterium]